MAARSNRRTLIVALAAASAVAAGYFVGTPQGRRRWRRFAERSGHVARRTRLRVRRRSRYLVATGYRRAMHAMNAAPPRQADGRTLLDRVESELFADRAIPHERITLDVEGQTVVLRGQLASEESIARVEDAVRAIPGVLAIRNLLHVAGTAAPNKVAALKASATALEFGDWPYEAAPDADSEDRRR